MSCFRLFAIAVLAALVTNSTSAQLCCDVAPLRFTEVNYNPTVTNACEFVELQNIGPTNLNLGGFSLDGVTFTFPSNTMLVAGARLILSSDLAPAEFAFRYPGVPVAGRFTGSLDNNGERLGIRDASGRNITAVHYRDGSGWPESPDGGGFTLEVIDLAGDPDDPANWRASAITNGTPLTASPPLPAPALVFNEVMAENATAVPLGTNFPDWVELRNASPTNLNLAGWSFSDGSNPRKYVFPPTNLPPGELLVVWCDNDTNSPGLHSGFVLNKAGQTLSLHDPATNRIDALAFGFQAKDKSIGRFGATWDLAEPTPGLANAAAVTAAPTNLVLNEWLVNPTPGKDDWFELHNRDTNRPVALAGLFAATPTALYQLRSISFLEPRGFLQIHCDENAGPDHVGFKLPADGGTIAIYDANGVLLDQVSYLQLSSGVSQGRLPDGNANIVTFTNSASPGSTNFFLDYSGPLLNEFMARNLATPVVDSQGRRADWIELFNPSALPFDLGGMRLSEGSRDRGEWFFPTGTVVAAHSHLVLWCDGLRPESTNVGPDLNLGRPLDGDTGGLFLFDAAGHLVDSVVYGPQVTDRSVGRVNGSWTLLAGPTPGGTNSLPAALGDPLSLTVNEWMAFPTGGADWFELFNADMLPVLLSGLYLADDPSPFGITNTLVQPLTFIAGRGHLQFIADGDPSQGASHVRFNLLSFGESILIYSPTLGIINQVDFGEQSQGQSEGRLPDGAPDENIIRFAFSPTPGTPNSLPIRPSVIMPPQSQTVSQFSNVTFSVMATGLPAPIYRWRFKGTNIAGATNSTLTISNVQLTSAGGYNVVLLNVAGTNNSSAALLTVIAIDTDLDGMPDVWETAHGLNISNALDATLDVDADGLVNLDEFRAGTDPQDVASVLRLEPFFLTPDGAVMEFLAVSNRSYTALYREAVVGSPWVPWANIPAAPMNRSLLLTNAPLSPGQRYFRVASP